MKKDRVNEKRNEAYFICPLCNKKCLDKDGVMVVADETGDLIGICALHKRAGKTTTGVLYSDDSEPNEPLHTREEIKEDKLIKKSAELLAKKTNIPAEDASRLLNETHIVVQNIIEKLRDTMNDAFDEEADKGYDGYTLGMAWLTTSLNFVQGNLLEFLNLDESMNDMITKKEMMEKMVRTSMENFFAQLKAGEFDV